MSGRADASDWQRTAVGARELDGETQAGGDPVSNVAVNVDAGVSKKQTWVYRYREAERRQP
jgi:hypothetical protein